MNYYFYFSAAVILYSSFKFKFKWSLLLIYLASLINTIHWLSNQTDLNITLFSDPECYEIFFIHFIVMFALFVLSKIMKSLWVYLKGFKPRRG